METTTVEPVAAAAAAPRRFEDLPGPRGLPWFGNFHQLETSRVHLQFEQWCHQYGPCFKLRLGGPVLVVGDHEVVASVLRNRPDTFNRTPRLNQIWLEMGLPPGVFGANGDPWRRQRRMVMAGFDPAHVKRYFPSLQQVAGRLARRWQTAAREGTTIDLQSDLMRYTVDTIAGLAFGSDVNTLESDHDVIQQHLDRIFPALSTRLIAPVPVWRYWRGKSDRELDRGVAEVNAAVDRFIEQARARMAADPELRERPQNLLEAMLAAADQPDSGIDDTVVAGNVVTMLLAGEDTTANTIAWMIHLLWRPPDMLARATEKVRREVDGGAAPTWDAMAQLEFVEACAHETMRLKPVAPILTFRAGEETVVGDVTVPAGTIVICLMRRDSVSDDHVPDAKRFNPERWLPGDGPAVDAGSAKRLSMPFGAGPRICPGRYLALLEMKMAMATVLSRFEIESVATPEGGEVREHFSFTMTPVGLRMRLGERV